MPSTYLIYGAALHYDCAHINIIIKSAQSLLDIKKLIDILIIMIRNFFHCLFRYRSVG